MKNQSIRDKYAALTVLSQRVLPSPTAVNKVSALLATRFHQPYQATETGRKSIIQQYPTPEGWDKEYLPAPVAEARQTALDLYLAESTPVKKVPEHLRLRESDLPKPLKREGGESNVEGVAQIILMLGSLYVPDEEPANAGEDVSGEEEE